MIVPNDTDPKRGVGYTEVPKSELFPDKSQRGVLENIFEDFSRSAARGSCVAAYLKYLWQEKMPRRSDSNPIDENSPQWRDARLALDGIIDLSQEQGIELIVYLHGSERALKTNRILGLYNRHLESRGIKALTIPERISGNPQYRNSIVDRHTNAAGHRILAEAIFEELKPRLVPESSKPTSDAPQ